MQVSELVAGVCFCSTCCHWGHLWKTHQCNFLYSIQCEAHLLALWCWRSITLEAQLMQFSLLYSMWSSLALSLALWCWRSINSRNTAWNKDVCVCVCVCVWEREREREREREKVWNLLRADCAKRKSIDIQKINSQSGEEGVRFVCVFSNRFFFLPMQGTPTIIV